MVGKWHTSISQPWKNGKWVFWTLSERHGHGID